MQKHILLILSTLLFSCQLFAQNEISFNISHKLADEEFAMNKSATNNINNTFSSTRLEYYISEISLVHDGGLETLIEDLWVLVDASRKTELSLGSHNISNIEKVRLHIGVDEAHNHLDPSSYDMSHPLAPKFPAMHWGWAAGYRFVAFEGFGGTALNQLFQLHGLGDVNYFTTEVDVTATAENDQISIELDADYTRALENISVNSGVIVHGDNFEAKQCLENFRDFVFSQSAISSSTKEFTTISSFSASPNPVSNSVAIINLETRDNTSDFDLRISSITGKQLEVIKGIRDGAPINLIDYAPGVYLLSVVSRGQILSTQKLIKN